MDTKLLVMLGKLPETAVSAAATTEPLGKTKKRRREKDASDEDGAAVKKRSKKSSKSELTDFFEPFAFRSTPKVAGADAKTWDKFQMDLAEHGMTMTTKEEEDKALDLLMQYDSKQPVKPKTDEQRCLDLEKAWRKILSGQKTSKRTTPTLDEIAYIKQIVAMQNKLVSLLPRAKEWKVRAEIDTREGRRIWPFVEFLESIELVKPAGMPCGDVHFLVHDHIVFVMERKSLTDLTSSKQSGSYAEQRARLLSSGFPINQIAYVFESEPQLYSPATLQEQKKEAKGKDQRQVMPWEQVWLTESRCRQRDGMAAYSSPHVLHTALMVLSDLAILIQEGAEALTIPNSGGKVRRSCPCPTCEQPEFELQQAMASSDYDAQLRVNGKKDLKTTERVQIKRFMCIPRITNPIARALAKEFPSDQALLRAFRDASNPEKLLCKVQYTDKGTQKFLKPKAAQNVYRVLHGKAL